MIYTTNLDIPNRAECQACSLTFAYHEIEMLYEIAEMLSHTEDTQAMMTQGLQILKRNNYLERCALYLLDEDKEYLTLESSIDLTEHQKKMAVYKLGEGATGLAASSKEPVVIENIHKSIDYLNKMGNIETNMVSYVAVPIIKNDEVQGVLSANILKNSTMVLDEIVRMLTITGSLFMGSLSLRKRYEQQTQTLNELKTYYKEEMLNDYKFENIIGRSTKMQQVFSIIETVAPSDATVFVRGETGTGKELIAAAIHNLSNRANAPFIKVNCAAISETLLESELFGHEKGAFTDAKEMRKGRFELADKGTLFLDEIGDTSPTLQVKLLRILQEQTFERVGGSKSIKVDVRLVAATNRNLEEMVKKGEFREDLFYRLNVIPINLPPLRERYEDVQLLLEHYLRKYMQEYKKTMHFSKASLELLQHYPWPGNIRELQNTVERIVLISKEGELEPHHLNHIMPYNFQQQYTEQEQLNVPTDESHIDTHMHELPTTKDNLLELEKEAITQALIDNRGIQTKAAKQLGMSPRQIGYKIKKYGIEI